MESYLRHQVRYTVVPNDRNITGYHFPHVCLAHFLRLQFYGCFPHSRNDNPSTYIVPLGRGRNRTELDLGCREAVEKWGFFHRQNLSTRNLCVVISITVVQQPVIYNVPLESLDPFACAKRLSAFYDMNFFYPNSFLLKSS